MNGHLARQEVRHLPAYGFLCRDSATTGRVTRRSFLPETCLAGHWLPWSVLGGHLDVCVVVCLEILVLPGHSREGLPMLQFAATGRSLSQDSQDHPEFVVGADASPCPGRAWVGARDGRPRATTRPLPREPATDSVSEAAVRSHLRRPPLLRGRAEPGTGSMVGMPRASLRQTRLAHAIDQAREHGGVLERRTLRDTLNGKAWAHPQRFRRFGLGLLHATQLGVSRRKQ